MTPDELLKLLSMRLHVARIRHVTVFRSDRPKGEQQTIYLRKPARDLPRAQAIWLWTRGQAIGTVGA